MPGNYPEESIQQSKFILLSAFVGGYTDFFYVVIALSEKKHQIRLIFLTF